MSDDSSNNTPLLFTNFIIQRLIVHFISRSTKSDDTSIRHSSKTIDVGSEGIEELSRRIIDAVRHRSQSLEMIFTSRDVFIYKETLKVFATPIEDKDFIKISIDITNHIYDIINKNKTIPLGAIVVLEGCTGPDNRKCFVIIKAETHNGFAGDIDESVHFIKNLFLTPEQKMYKVAFIIDNPKYIFDNKEKLPSIKNKIKQLSDKNDVLKKSYCIYKYISNNNKKTEFAFDLIYIESDSWNVPTYIKEGLLWLAK